MCLLRAQRPGREQALGSGTEVIEAASIKDLYYVAHGSTADALRDIAHAGTTRSSCSTATSPKYADELERLLDKHGLVLVAVYSGANFIFTDILDQELWRIDRAAWLGARCGARHLVVGGGAQTLQPPGEPAYERLAAALDRVMNIAERHGLTACFHPHLTTIVETAEQLDRLLPRTSISLCPDTGHVLLAGDDPATLIRAHGDRIPYVHLKDADPQTGAFVPLGTGALDLPGVMQALGDIGCDGWITVELDAWADPAEGAGINRHALEPWSSTGAAQAR